MRHQMKSCEAIEAHQRLLPGPPLQSRGGLGPAATSSTQHTSTDHTGGKANSTDSVYSPAFPHPLASQHHSPRLLDLLPRKLQSACAEACPSLHQVGGDPPTLHVHWLVVDAGPEHQCQNNTRSPHKTRHHTNTSKTQVHLQHRAEILMGSRVRQR